MSLRALVLAGTAVAATAGGCGGDGSAAPAGADQPAQHTPSPAASSPTPSATPRARQRLVRARCAPDAGNCAAVSGRVLYVEAVDPDGDGDAHYLLAGGNVTAPGLTAVDVERALRPHRLPRVGDRVSAAGPVYIGSHGQRQIQAVELHYARRQY
jgi:hypothetical protein